MRTPTLLTRFAALSLVAFAALGLLLGVALHRGIERRALADAVRTAAVASRMGIEPHLTEDSLRSGVDRATSRSLAAATQRAGLRRVKVFDPDGRIIWSDDRALIGDRHPEVEGVRLALAGRTTSHITSFAHGGEELGTTLEVYLPLVVGEVRGVGEVYLPYDAVRSEVRSEQLRLGLGLLVGLGLLWGVLFRLVHAASRRLQRELRHSEHLAHHDALTGLPNRSLLFERVADRARRPGPFAVVLIDLDRFKEINDTLGHHNGDALLVEVGNRIDRAIGSDDVVARLGGDEFAVLLAHVDDHGAALARARDLTALVEEPVLCDGLTLSVGGSAGIAVSPEHGTSPEELLKRADVAMYLAKQRRTRAELYEAARDHHSADRLALAGELKGAIEREELFLLYQPKADVRTGEVTGVEALVRWRHPVHGVLPPDAFVPLAEQAGLIGPLTDLVLDHALRQVREWWDDGHRLSVAVNLSPWNLQDAELPDEIRSLLAGTGVLPEALVLEITESAIVTDPERAAEVLDELHEIGVRVAIDDFGTGYSSLAYLQRLTVDELKIDRGFIQSMTSSPSDEIIVRATIDLGRNLGLKVVAEGVEDGAAWDRLAELDCDELQGFFLARPIDGGQIPAWVNRHRRSGVRSPA